VASNLTQTHESALATRFAHRNDIFGPSIWTEILKLFKHHADPIYFGDGSPDRSAIPLARLRDASLLAWEDAPGHLGYGDQQGYAPLRDLIAERMAPLGVTADPGQILVTSGSTQGIDLACRVFLEPDDVVICENPTFLGATELFHAYQARIVPIATDAHGMRMDDLEAALAAEPRAKFIYTIPTFQNPTGTTMPLDRRQRLVDLARQYNVAVLEDDPYVELRYDGELASPLRSLDAAVIYLGTFSKTIAPGVRTGWTVAPPEVHRLLLANREVADISNDRITMRTVYHTAVDFLVDHVRGTLDIYRQRRNAMLDALEEYMPEQVTWSRPDGGFFVWITLPEHLDATALATAAADNGVIYFPGQWFFPNHDHANTLRLSFSTVPEDRIVEGIRRLAHTLREAGLA
jgi:DNA-binding transcriptional MocR family regulator